MKKLLLLFVTMFNVLLVSSQNIGIGTSSPQYRLDIKGGGVNVDSGYRIGGRTVLFIKDTGNTFNGLNSGYTTTGNHNSGFGFGTLYSNTAGYSNTALGASALYSNTTGFSNTAAGYKTLYSNISGTYNTAIGWQSLYANTTGQANTAVGEALEFNTTGSYNTGIGHGALYKNTTADANTALGSFALLNTTTGHSNTAIGVNALRTNIAGSSNTAIGVNALYSVNNHYNTAIGHEALYSNTSYNNSAVGYKSLFGNTSGTNNAALGYFSLWENSTGSLNTALGSYALVNNTSGSFNVAVGANSLDDNSTGRYNVAHGFVALTGNTTGEGNVGIGYWTLSQNGASNYNTAVGHEAGRGHLHGWNNTFIGAFTNGAGSGFFNCIAIGANASATASNQVRIGNSSNTSIGGFANWTNISDGRFKKNIKEDVKGLDFILQLRPVTYQLDITGLRKKLNESNEQSKDSKMDLAANEKESMIQAGFVAQEVESAAKNLGFDFSGVDKPKNENDLYGLRYAEFVVPLVKAVQEQQDIIEEMRMKLESLEAELIMLKGKKELLVLDKLVRKDEQILKN